MQPVAFIVREGWSLGHSGVATFIREVMGIWGISGRCELVELPGGPLPSGVGVIPQPDVSVLTAVPLVNPSEGPSSLRLFAGYIKLLLQDAVNVWRARKQLQGRIILTNDFGCETLPLAFRLVCPTSTIVAFSHTHPGQDSAARHSIRKCVENLCARSVTKVLFNSYASQALWNTRLRMKFKSNVVHLGIGEPDRRIPGNYPPKFRGCVDFVCVARFVAWKGHRQLVEGWRAALRLGMVNSRLILVGDGECWPDIKALVESSKLQDSVLLLGPQREGSLFFNAGDVAVQLSVEPEAFGLVALEAMARGKPVLASNLGGLGELVENGVNGLLVDPVDTNAVGKMILAMAVDPDLRFCCGNAGRARWGEKFTALAMVARLEQVM